MTAETLKTIVRGLNEEPFNMQLNFINFDSLPSEKLLQILSDVLRWVESAPRIEIFQESAEDTALRIFDTLRILKFKPPANIEQLQEWRRGIVEGEKAAIYPVLEWIFNNCERLKERAYLAKYLIKIDIPGEYQDVETADLTNQIAELIEQFKDVHSRAAETRKDTVLVDDIRSDLKTMEQEKEYLLKKVEKTNEKLRNVPNLQKLLDLASNFRLENRRKDILTLQIQEQTNAITHCEMKMQRLGTILDELKTIEVQNTDPNIILKQLQDELETNRYIVEDKLPKEIELKRSIVSELSKVANMPAISENDIADLQARIELVNEEILRLVKKSEGQDENTSDLFLYRHQVAAINRKKAVLAEKLEKNRSELQKLENLIVEKKKELRTKTGEDDIISSAEFKQYVNDVRTKGNNYRKMREIIDFLKAEEVIVLNTNAIIQKQWNDDKKKIELRGGTVIEEHDRIPSRPQTAKPQTNDVNELKIMIKELNDSLDLKREVLSDLTEYFKALNSKLAGIQEQYSKRKESFEETQSKLGSVNAGLFEKVQDIELRFSDISEKCEEKKAELENVKQTLADLENCSDNDDGNALRAVEKEIDQTKHELEELQKYLGDMNVEKDLSFNSEEQVKMWKSLLKIFEAKLQILLNPESS